MDEPDESLNELNESVEQIGVVDIAGEVRAFSENGWPTGYVYGATRYADVILRESFPSRFRDIVAALERFAPTLTELRTSGGGRTVFVKRFDDSLQAMVEEGVSIWGKQNITIEKAVGLDGTTVRTSKARGHEIDMFGKGTSEYPLPGIAVEMEWNNKDPFFDRDLINFQALHREGAIAVGVIVTRGPSLQALIGPTVRSRDAGYKYGQSSTHWNKLLPKVNLGGGGECPLLLIGIEPGRIVGIDLAIKVKEGLDELYALRETWREHWETYKEAQTELSRRRIAVMEAMPPLADETPVGEDEVQI
jgi:hypothetical protein